jgi:hypothetical protein
MRGYALRTPATPADSVEGATQIRARLMSGSYRQCVECGKRALNFATRCPGCGIDLPDPAPFTPDDSSIQLNWSHSLKAVAVVLAIAGGIVGLERGTHSTTPLSAESAMTGERAAGRRSEREPGSAVDTVMVEATAAATVAPSTVTPPPATVTLVAQSWTNVRSRRSKTASLEAMLEPGDTVTADSLVAGYYRVAMYGEVLGWAKEANLARTSP